LQAVDRDEVELVGFDVTGERSFYGGGGSFGISWSRLLQREDAARLRALIAELPSGQSARCHTPPFGVLFGAPPRQIHVTICFRCNNLYVDRTLIAFDAASAQAQALLAFLRSQIPREASVK
jgi:hypothetical protein